MELKLTHEPICINDIVFDGLMEQSIELDYLLPDYYPNIFKIMKCKLETKGVTYRISADKMVVDGIAYIKIIYVCEETNLIKSIVQKSPFSKTIDLKYAPERPIVTLNAKADYVNCRVVNSRRLDIRGVVSIRAKVVEQNEEEVICDASGMGVQVKKRMVNVGGRNLGVCKSFTVREDLEVETESDTVGSVIYSQAGTSAGIGKIIADKFVAKGEIFLHTLYTTGENNNMEIAEHTIPISQIVDMQGLTEEYTCQVYFDIIGVEVGVTSEEGDHFFNVELSVCVYVYAYEEKEMQCIDDMFSTIYDSSMNSKSMKTERILEIVNRSIENKTQIELPENIMTVFDVWCSVKNISPKMENGAIVFLVDVETCIIALDEEEMPAIIEKMITFELSYETDWQFPNIKADVNVSVLSINKALSGERTLEIDMGFKIEGILSIGEEINIITEIMVDQEKTKTNENLAPLTLYYADKGERIWDIAKRYNTSINAILEENDIDYMEIPKRGMLLIPVIN